MAAIALGFDEAGTGPLFLLVHGFPLDRRMWRHQLGGLADVRRVVAVDLRGRGKSPVPGPSFWTMDDLADDLAATIVSLGAERADVAGLSMGGYVAFSLWRRHPEVFRSLILADTRAQEDSPEAKAGREKTAALVSKEGAGALVEEMLPRLLSPKASELVREEAQRMIEDTPVATAAADCYAMRDRPDSTIDLTSIDVPTLVVHGVDDELVPLPQAEQMVDLIPEARLAPIPGAGHLAPLENPEAVDLAIRDFFSGIEA